MKTLKIMEKCTGFDMRVAFVPTKFVRYMCHSGYYIESFARDKRTIAFKSHENCLT